MSKYLMYLKKHPKPSSAIYEFKMLHTFETRKKEAEKLYNNHSDKIFTIVERSDSTDIPDTDRIWAVKHELTIGQFIYNLKTSLKLSATDTIVLYVNNQHIPKISESFKDIYCEHKDKDGFLYITYSKP